MNAAQTSAALPCGAAWREQASRSRHQAAAAARQQRGELRHGAGVPITHRRAAGRPAPRACPSRTSCPARHAAETPSSRRLLPLPPAGTARRVLWEAGHRGEVGPAVGRRAAPGILRPLAGGYKGIVRSCLGACSAAHLLGTEVSEAGRPTPTHGLLPAASAPCCEPHGLAEVYHPLCALLAARSSACRSAGGPGASRRVLMRGDRRSCADASGRSAFPALAVCMLRCSAGRE